MAPMTPMAKQLQRSPPGNRGACLLYATAQFRRVPDSQRVKIDNVSIKESIKLGRITSTDVIKATRQKPRNCPQSLK